MSETYIHILQELGTYDDRLLVYVSQDVGIERMIQQVYRGLWQHIIHIDLGAYLTNVEGIVSDMEQTEFSKHRKVLARKLVELLFDETESILPKHLPGKAKRVLYQIVGDSLIRVSGSSYRDNKLGYLQTIEEGFLVEAAKELSHALYTRRKSLHIVIAYLLFVYEAIRYLFGDMSKEAHSLRRFIRDLTGSDNFLQNIQTQKLLHVYAEQVIRLLSQSSKLHIDIKQKLEAEADLRDIVSVLQDVLEYRRGYILSPLLFPMTVFYATVYVALQELGLHLEVFAESGNSCLSKLTVKHINQSGAQFQKYVTEILGLMSEEQRTYYKSILSGKNVVLFAAESTELGLVGFIITQVKEQEIGYNTCLYIHEIFVRDDCRGLNIGQKLMSTVLQFTRSRKLDCITLTVDESNTLALNWYIRLGFIGTNKTSDNHIYMVYWLRPLSQLVESILNLELPDKTRMLIDTRGQETVRYGKYEFIKLGLSKGILAYRSLNIISVNHEYNYLLIQRFSFETPLVVAILLDSNRRRIEKLFVVDIADSKDRIYVVDLVRGSKQILQKINSLEQLYTLKSVSDI